MNACLAARRTSLVESRLASLACTAGRSWQRLAQKPLAQAHESIPSALHSPDNRQNNDESTPRNKKITENMALLCRRDIIVIVIGHDHS
ncbi:hypothetical protein [Azotobacter chroococcum]|uniref:hypothetical protein n=1 Tax=Azotobacter chroococcum TaxID=353 RepID=UPI001186C5B2|nr:hypothetical protein [Azotobacter chroococcum]